MPLVHIIGNGFDINAGLPTRYSDFYKYYLGDSGSILGLKNILDNEYLSEPVSPAIKNFKDDLSADINTWSDMEIALGKYCGMIGSADLFDEIFIDLGDQLKLYLEHVEHQIPKISSSIDAMEEFYESLLQPEKFVNNPWSDHAIKQRRMQDVSVISFNYTRTMEVILSPDELPIHHVHGTLQDEIIIGVNSINQIINNDFRSNQDITDALVKPTTSKIVNNSVVEQCISTINNADVISIFGSSLGPTDQFWWDLIGKRVSTGKLKVIISHIASDKDLNRVYKKNKITRNLRDKFKPTEISSFDDHAENIAVITSSNMFNVFNS